MIEIVRFKHRILHHIHENSSQVPLADHIDDKHKKVSQSKSAPNSPVRRVVPLTLETAVELKYDLQETVIPYPQVIIRFRFGTKQ